MRMEEFYIGKRNNETYKFKIMVVTPNHPEFKFGSSNLWKETEIEEDCKNSATITKLVWVLLVSTVRF